MLTNRSVPVDTVIPHLVYRSVRDAITWLTHTFGFEEHFRYGEAEGTISGAQMHFRNAWIMLSGAREGSASPAQLGGRTQSLTIFVEDIDAHYEHSKAAGAKIVEDLHETVYGERQYGVEDLDGHLWIFSRHARDLSPGDWGATASQTATGRLALLQRPRLCYLQIPAGDLAQSVGFYEKVFGWNIRHRDSGHPSFDDATGNVSGAWVTGRAATPEAGLLPYIWVDSVDVTLCQVTIHGGKVVEAPHLDSTGGTSWIATFQDPAGNTIGLYQEGPR